MLKKRGKYWIEVFNQTPVDKYKFDEFYDVVGNVWQWSLTPTYPFDDFENIQFMMILQLLLLMIDMHL